MHESSPKPAAGTSLSRIGQPTRPDRRPGDPWTPDSLAGELIWQQWVDDSYDDVTERRLIALEEALVSRKARRRLRREIRKSAGRFAWVGSEFTWRRLEAVSNDWLCRDRDRQAAA
jgi:hypothetical protein